MVIAQHGGGGTPEFASDMYGENAYCNFTKRALERGIAVFAPCLLLWQFGIDTGEKRPKYDIRYDRDEIDRSLRRLGYGIIGLEIYNIMRCIDLFSEGEYIDASRIGMMGLSYGGFFTLYTSALDKRIKSIYSAAAFNDRSHVALSDWLWRGQSLKFHDAEAVGLCAPRSIVIDVGACDRVFDHRYASAEAERALLYYKYLGKSDKFYFNLHNGGHTFDTDGDGFSRFFSALENNEE